MVKSHEDEINLVLNRISSSLNSKKTCLNIVKNIKKYNTTLNLRLKNILTYLLHDTYKVKDSIDLSELIEGRILKSKFYLENSKRKIISFASRKISKNMLIFTQGNYTLVAETLLNSKPLVHLTETSPNHSGRKLAKLLSSKRIKNVCYVDNALRQALKKSDLILLGADSITSDGKLKSYIGSELIAEVARNYHIPIYVCIDSLSFDKGSIQGKGQKLSEKFNFWPQKPKNTKLDNSTHEFVSPDLVTGVVSELGIFKPEVYVEEVRANYTWLFS